MRLLALCTGVLKSSSVSVIADVFNKCLRTRLFNVGTALNFINSTHIFFRSRSCVCMLRRPSPPSAHAIHRTC